MSTDLAMFVDGCAAQSDLRADHVRTDAVGWGLGRRAARAVLGRRRDEVPTASARALAEVESFNGSVIDRVSDIVNAQLRVLVP